MALAVIVWIEDADKNARHGSTPAFASLLTIPVAVVSMGAYVTSLTLTTVANVMVVYATVPLVAAGLAWIAMRERPGGAALVASLLALLGVFVMVSGAIHGRNLLGIVIAFMMTFAMGAQIVLARRFPDMRMSMVNLWAASVCAIVGLALGDHKLPPPSELLTLMLFGVTNTALAYYFVLRGARLIRSAETGLISTLDVVLGPLWVWLWFAETPSSHAFVGGGIVLVSVLVYLLTSSRHPDSRVDSPH